MNVVLLSFFFFFVNSYVPNASSCDVDSFNLTNEPTITHTKQVWLIWFDYILGVHPVLIGIMETNFRNLFRMGRKGISDNFCPVFNQRHVEICFCSNVFIMTFFIGMLCYSLRSELYCFYISGFIGYVSEII